ncbi:MULTISPECIES: hypothetical protein [unclassified Novosphingobium]|uniref:hypothetical protein n=1 Tax=unclassified Novosphingobium TaxID=2644732 RepID=UPI0013581137|nr:MULTISPECIES: hypothetical protein [unclassified Novosphingobium]
MSSLFVILFIAAIVGIFKPYIKGAKRWHFGLAAFVFFILIAVFADPKPVASPSESAGATASGSAESSDPSEPNAESAKPESKWTYSTNKDEMRGSESHYASLKSDAEIQLDFPYGEQTPEILIRQSPKFGFDILVGVASGQIQCSEYSDGHLSVKFDDGPIQRFGCTEAADGSSNMVFVDNAKSFLAKLKTSKKVIVEAQFYQNGMQQMTFQPAGLEWPKK